MPRPPLHSSATMTMSSSSLPIAASTDHSFFSHSKASTSGSSLVVTTRVVAIPQGEPFAGRTYGGGTRDLVYGTRCVSPCFLRPAIRTRG